MERVGDGRSGPRKGSCDHVFVGVVLATSE